jgi:hypothetical protein
MHCSKELRIGTGQTVEGTVTIAKVENPQRQFERTLETHAQKTARSGQRLRV